MEEPALVRAAAPAAGRASARGACREIRFGLERATDSAGAIVGPLVAVALVASIGLRATFVIATARPPAGAATPEQATS